MSYQRSFNRFELKYIIPIAEAEMFLDGISDYLELDPNSNERGEYNISSLYYDSPDFHFFWEKLEGLRFRRKLRIRRYLDSKDEVGMMEIKQRVDRTVQKRRIALPLATIFSLIPPPEGENRFLSTDDNKAVDQIELEKTSSDAVVSESLSLVAGYNLQPKTLVNYTRKAYQAIYDNDLRITVDTNLKCRIHALDWKEVSEEENDQILPADEAVIEIKFNESVPYWLTEQIAYFECNLQRISKYCNAVNRLVYHNSIL